MIKRLLTPLKKYVAFLLLNAGVVLLVLSCTSFPVPTEKGDSLFVLLSEVEGDSTTSGVSWSDNIYFSGPSPFVIKVSKGGWKLHFKRVKPGWYKIIRREVIWPSGRVERITSPLVGYIKIQPDSIFLFPRVIRGKFTPDRYYRKYARDITPQDQYRISKELPQYIGFSEWVGKRFQGFGRYRPSFALEKARYDVKITSVPAGARVFVDGVFWGTTPIVVQLKSGKHQLLMRKKGFFDYRTFIDVTSDTEITTKLVTIATEKEKPKQEIKVNQFSVLIEPFINIGSRNFDYLTPVFSDVLKVDMFQDKRLFVESLDTHGKLHSSEFPNFKVAYKRGFDLLVHGQYYATKNKIFIHATLYDVKSERVKTSIAYSGEAGLGIFDSIDEMGKQFLGAVSRVLPPEGKRIVEEKREINQKIVTLEKKVTKQQVIERRRKQKWAYSVCGGVGGHLDYITDSNSVSMVANGPQVGLLGSYEFELFGPLDMVLKFQPTFIVSPGGGSVEENGLDFPFWAGLQFDFLGYRTALYTSLLGLFRYTSVGKSYYYDDTLGEEIFREFGPYFYAGVVVDTGLKYYTYERFDQKASFFTVGFMLGILEYRFESGFENLTPVNVDINMYLGFGSRM